MKKKGDEYGDFDGLMYPFSNYSLMNSHSESSSPLAIGYILQSMAFGAFGNSSMAWSHVLSSGNRCDSFSLKVLACLQYSSGTICLKVFFVLSIAFWASSDAVVVFRSMAYGPPLVWFILSHSSLVIVADIWASSGLRLDITTGWHVLSKVASFQWMMGSNAVSQGYPRITLSFPKLVMRNRRVFVSVPMCTCKSVKWLMVPSWLCVLPTFQILIGVSTRRYPILSLWSRFLEIKLSVAPKLTRTSLSAVACADSNKTGIHMDQYLLLYMLIHSALAQAARFRCWENPFCQTIRWWSSPWLLLFWRGGWRWVLGPFELH